MNRRRLNSIKPVYDPDRPAGRLNLTQPAPLTNWVNIPAVLVAGATATQNSPFSSVAVAITIASTHCAYPRRDGQAELSCVAGYAVRQFTCLKTITHPTTNRAQCKAKATALIETNALPATATLNRHLRRKVNVRRHYSELTKCKSNVISTCNVLCFSAHRINS